MIARSAPILALLMFALGPGFDPVGQAAGPEPWDVTKARGRTRKIDFSTDEGTLVSVDVSPDGKWIAFISDREGQNNLWIIEADGSDPNSVVIDPDARMSQPSWLPDSDCIVFRRHEIAPGWESTNDGIWMAHREGGKGIQLIGEEHPEAAWPSVSPDGRHLYFHTADRADANGGRADSLGGTWQVRRFDFRTGQVVEMSAGRREQQYRSSSGGMVAPEISPDGKTLAFARAFPKGKDVELVLKVSNAHRFEHWNRLKGLLSRSSANRANIRFMMADLPREGLLRLLSAADCYVSLHHAEGFGYICAEAMAYRKPVIATRYSGNLEFMNDENSFLVQYEEADVAVPDGPFQRGSIWANPCIDHAAQLMRQVYEQRQKASGVGRVAARSVRHHISPQAVSGVVKQALLD